MIKTTLNSFLNSFKKVSFTKKIDLLTVVMISILLSFLIREFFTQATQQKHSVVNEFEAITSELAAEAKLIHGFVTGGRLFAENHFKFNRSAISPWFSYLKPDPQFNGSYLQGLSPAYAEQKLGNLTLISGDYLHDKELKEEINMALFLGDFLASGIGQIKTSPWFYYTSHDFIYLAPYVGPKDFFFKPETREKEFYTHVTPALNPEKNGIWTKIYIDEAGKGLMVTYSEPVYDGPKFRGAIAMDVTLSQFNSVLSRKEQQIGKFILFNKAGEVLGHTGKTSSIDNSISTISQWIPTPMLDFILAHSDDHGRKLKIAGTNLVLFSPFHALNSTLVFYASIPDFLIFVLKNMAALFMAFSVSVILVLKLRKTILTDHQLQQGLLQTTKMAALGQMATGMAHEINNPLTIILHKADVVSAMIQSEKPLNRPLAVEHLKNIMYTVDRIAKIIRGLNAFARNSERDPFSPCLLKVWIENTFQLCKESLKSQNIELRVSAIPDVWMMARESQLSQVLLNLLNNSVDALRKSSNKIISISFKIEQKVLTIYVKDSGPPISPEIQAHLMEPFFTTKPPGHGTGLGLSISHGIMLDHQGSLNFYPDQPETCFVIKIPLLSSPEIELDMTHRLRNEASSNLTINH